MVKTEIDGSGHQLQRVELEMWQDGWAGWWGQDRGTQGKLEPRSLFPKEKYIYLGEPSSLLTMHLGNPATICVSVPVH